MDKKQSLGRGRRPNNPVARRVRRERALALNIEKLELHKDKYTPEQIKTIEQEIANLRDILSGDRWIRIKQQGGTIKVLKKKEAENRFENEVIDCYSVVPRYMSKKKKKAARRSGTKDTHLDVGGGVRKGWKKIFRVTFNNRPGLMALLRSGKHPNFRFDPSNPDDRKVFQTRNRLVQPNPVNKG